MAKETKVQPTKLPNEFPMPAYGYQKPASGTYSGQTDNNRPYSPTRDSTKPIEPIPALQNLKLAI